MWTRTALAAFAVASLAGVGMASALVEADTQQRCFPDGFLFGAATSAAQVEGAWNELGRTPMVFDETCVGGPPLECPYVTVDFLHRYKDDIKLMTDIGLSSFRFSISWTRVMTWDPTTQRMKPNPPGIAFYHELVDALRAASIEPIVTVFHWDFPQDLYVALNTTWPDARVIDHFAEFAELVFNEYGTKARYWGTFNEPYILVRFDRNPYVLTESSLYVAAHNVLLSHATAVKRFRELQSQGKVLADAKIGLVYSFDYIYPKDNTSESDVEAAARARNFTLGWFLEPLVTGEYPAVMRERVGDRLPTFTAEEAAMVKGSYDVLLLNSYSSNLAVDCSSPEATTNCSSLAAGWDRDAGVDASFIQPTSIRSAIGEDGEYVSPRSAGYAEGYADSIRFLHSYDTAAPILLTENGYAGNTSLDNTDQTKYYSEFISQVYTLVTEEHLPIVGYTVWSLFDNWEWGTFDARYGLYYVDFPANIGAKDYVPKPTDLTRTLRAGGKFYGHVATSKCLGPATASGATPSNSTQAPSPAPVVCADSSA